ncbi:MAG: DHHA1 domain-containing protein [Mycoplasmoidaceae bacterium]|nr:DHHA1 domain-containing protein [Mycoplasmoidaceae bacterium]
MFDELAQQLEKEMVEFKFAKIKKDVNDFINNFKLNEQPYNTIVLHNVDNEFITILSKQLLDKYKDNGFVILNITSKLSYVVCKSAKANISKCNDVIKQINKLTNGRGGGKENFCQGSTQDIQTKDKIINLISQIK